MSAEPGGEAAGRMGRRLRSAAALAVVVVLGLTGCSSTSERSSRRSTVAATASTNRAAPSGSAGTSAAPTEGGATAAVPTTAATPVASGSSVRPGALSTVPAIVESSLAPVGLSSVAQVDAATTVSIARITHVTVTDQGPGIITGAAAIELAVVVTNASRSTVDAGSAEVAVVYGPAATPAPEVNLSTAHSEVGSIPPGRSATVTSTFAVPLDQQGDVRISVRVGSARPTALFEGSVRP